MHPIIASAPLTAPDAVVAIPGDAWDKYPTRVECDGVDGGLGSGIGQQDRDEKRGQDGMISLSFYSLPPGLTRWGACPGGGAVRAVGLAGYHDEPATGRLSRWWSGPARQHGWENAVRLRAGSSGRESPTGYHEP